MHHACAEDLNCYRVYRLLSVKFVACRSLVSRDESYDCIVCAFAHVSYARLGILKQYLLTCTTFALLQLVERWDNACLVRSSEYFVQASTLKHFLVALSALSI